MVLKGADVTALFTHNVPETIVHKYAEDILFSNDQKDKSQFVEDYYAVKGNFSFGFVGHNYKRPIQ